MPRGGGSPATTRRGSPGSRPTLAIGRWRRDRRLTEGQPVLRAVTDRVDPAVRLELVAALRALPRRQREVVTLRYLADLPEAEVAAALGCSAGTVKQHAHRGLAALRSRLGHLDDRTSTDPEEGRHVRAAR